jgi:hypothetical protein
MESRILGLLAAGLLAGPMSANGVEIQSGTAIYVTFRHCVAAPTGRCGYLSEIVDSANGGQPGGSTAFAQLIDANFGTTVADSSLTGRIGAPILRAATTSISGKRVNTNTVALQRYVYTGSEPAVRTFGGSLTYAQTMDDGLNAAYTEVVRSGVNALINVFKMDPESFEVGDTAQSYFDNMAFTAAFEAEPGYELLGSARFNDIVSTPLNAGSLAVTVSLHPGDAIWVWTLLQTPSADGASVDVSRMMITGFDDVTDLQPANEITPAEQLENLLEGVTALGPGGSLATKVMLARTYYAVSDIASTCSVLSDLIHQVSAQTGKKIDVLTANEVIADARAVMVAMNCN